jgi:hypothetical protein
MNWLDLNMTRVFETFKNSHNIKYIRPSEYLDKTKFQSSSLGDNTHHKNLGDPEGYCLAWSYWFVELKMLNPEVDEKKLVNDAYNKIMKSSEKLESNQSTQNPILQYIRGYARHLDKEKNKIFETIGIQKHLNYKLIHDSANITDITKYVNNFVIKQLQKSSEI